MVHQYKLIYFNGRGLAEPSRLIFAYAGADYEDHRIQRENWPALKPTTPFGQVPVLDIDNGKVVISQSKAIARYLGNEFNLVPKDNILATKADMIVDGVGDLMVKLAPWRREQDPAKKQEMWQKIETEDYIPFLKIYEKFLNETGTGYFVTNTITWADLVVFNFLQNTQNNHSNLFDGLPKLTEFITKIANEPKIKAWLEKRPKTEF